MIFDQYIPACENLKIAAGLPENYNSVIKIAKIDYDVYDKE